MKLYKIIFSLVLASFVFIGCKDKEAKKEEVQKEIVTADTKELALNISGMTCEIGCAKFIESKLSKEAGVVDAKVIFNDSTAVVKYDPAKTNKASLVSLVNGLADNMYTATEGKSCSGSSKKACCANKEGKDCSSASAEDKKSCSTDCKSACCDTKEVKEVTKTSCTGNTKEACCANKEGKACTASVDDKKSCNTDCKKACCA